jgi:glycosyltransferase involved in cell wall biosynthesis
VKKILVITDMDSVGSGYKHIAVPLLTAIQGYAEYEIKILGFSYRGEEHHYPFSVIPASTLEEVVAMAANLLQLWCPDILLVAMDLPIQSKIFEQLSPLLNRLPNEEDQTRRKYIAITPLENGPLCLDWAAPLFSMDGVFFISELGKQEAHKVGVIKAEHLQVGVDSLTWRPATPEEKVQLRNGLGIPQDAFVVLTVADNQERKNLWAGMDAVARLKNMVTQPIRYILVTREKNPFGYKLRSLANDLGIQSELIIYERGMSQENLWGLYAAADVYLQPSKAEGLGLPVLDAMCVKLPVVATDTGAMHELLDDHRGYLVPGEYEFTDVWGNSRRVMMNRSIAAEYLKDVAYENTPVPDAVSKNAYEYILRRTWNIPAEQLHRKIVELFQ